MTDRLQEQPSPAQGTLSLTACLLWLSLVLGVALLCVGGFAYSWRGVNGLWAAVVACGVCWVAGGLALVVVRVTQALGQAIGGLLAATLIRMALPLVVGYALYRQGGPLADAGVFGLTVIFYMVMLVTEAYLSVRLVKQSTEKTKAS